MMREKRVFLLAVLGLVVGFGPFRGYASAQTPALRFDGVYQSKVQSESEISGKKYKFWDYLGFTTDGTVLGTSAVFPPQELLKGPIAKMFSLRGRYAVKGSQIKFSLTFDGETTDYVGSIEPDGLKLESYQRWNQLRNSMEYHFVPLAAMGRVFAEIGQRPTVLAGKSGVRLEVISRSPKSMVANDYGQPSQVFSDDGLLLLKYEYNGAFLRAARVRLQVHNDSAIGRVSRIQRRSPQGGSRKEVRCGGPHLFWRIGRFSSPRL
jgi:hypothetical protein